MASAPTLLAGLPPVIFSDTRILILGSFPGEASLAAGRYYAHPRNQFWRLLSAALNENLAALAYASRLDRLRQHAIGLWDVIAVCEREGSLDSAIRHAQPADFSHLKARHPAVRKICFNGKTSGKFAHLFESLGYQTLTLPSSSPANAQLSFEQKLVRWRELTG